MKTSISICAGLLLQGAASIAPAAAQLVPIDPRGYEAGLPPYQVMTIVRTTGLTPVSRPIRRGPNYVVIATDRSGGHVRVVVDAYYGEIRRINPLMRPYPNAWAAAPPYNRPPGLIPIPGPGYVPEARNHPLPPDNDPGYGPRVGGYESTLPPSAPHAGLDSSSGLVPPRTIPNMRMANAPSALTPAPRTARTPLPRPRPSVASNDATASGPAAPSPQSPAIIMTPSPTAAVQPPAKTPATTSAAKPDPNLVPVAPLE